MPTATPASTSTLTELADMPADSVVRVVVKAAHPAGMEFVPALNARDFSSSLEYRAALIRQHKAGTAALKSTLADKARALGVSASTADTLNAITLEGSPQRLLELLQQVPVEAAVMERPLGR